MAREANTASRSGYAVTTQSWAGGSRRVAGLAIGACVVWVAIGLLMWWPALLAALVFLLLGIVTGSASDGTLTVTYQRAA